MDFENKLIKQEDEMKKYEIKIKDYKKATNDSIGTVDLIITYVKEAIEYSNEYCYCEEDIED